MSCTAPMRSALVPLLGALVLAAWPRAGTCALEAPPPELVELEGVARHLGESGALGDWYRARWLVGRADRAIAALAAPLGAKRTRALRRRLGSIRAAVTAQRPRGTQVAALKLSEDLVEILPGYRTRVPVDVRRLDILLRKTRLDADAGSYGRARARFREAGALWSRVRGALPREGTPAEQNFQHAMREVDRSLGLGLRNGTFFAIQGALDRLQALEASW